MTARMMPLRLRPESAVSLPFCILPEAMPLQIMAMAMSATPVKRMTGSPFGDPSQLTITPRTSESPTPRGNATDIPAIDVEAESRMLEALKMMPPRITLQMLAASA